VLFILLCSVYSRYVPDLGPGSGGSSIKSGSDQIFVTKLHRESKKNKTPNSYPYLRQILIDFQNSFTITLGRKLNLQQSDQYRSHHISKVSLHYLVKYYFPKTAATWKHNSSTSSAYALLRNVTAVDKLLLVLSNYDETSFNTLNSTICGHKGHFLHGDLGLKCPNRRLLKNWLNTATRDLSAQNSCWIVIFIWFSGKNYSH